MQRNVIFVALAVCGCTREFVYPVTGQMNDGTPAGGQATAGLSGEGNLGGRSPTWNKNRMFATAAKTFSSCGVLFSCTSLGRSRCQ